MKKLISTLFLFILCLFSYGCAEKTSPADTSPDTASSSGASQGAPIHLSDDKEIAFVQLNLSKIDTKKYNLTTLETLIDGLKNLTPLSASETKEVTRGEDYKVISLIYEDGTRDMFYFFHNNPEETKWYAETTDGFVYENADFINEIADFNGSPASSEDVSAAPLEMNPELLKEQLKLQQTMDEPDLCYTFAVSVRNIILTYGADEEQAIKDTRTAQTSQLTLYHYALREGYEISEDELTERVEMIISVFENASNFDEYKTYFDDAGTSVRETFEQNRENTRRDLMAEKVYYQIQEDFRHGRDKINDTVYNDLNSYRNAFYAEVILPSTDRSTKDEIEKELDDAESFYHENFG